MDATGTDKATFFDQNLAEQFPEMAAGARAVGYHHEKGQNKTAYQFTLEIAHRKKEGDEAGAVEIGYFAYSQTMKKKEGTETEYYEIVDVSKPYKSGVEAQIQAAKWWCDAAGDTWDENDFTPTEFLTPDVA